jgi:hypothetical protein
MTKKNLAKNKTELIIFKKYAKIKLWFTQPKNPLAPQGY